MAKNYAYVGQTFYRASAGPARLWLSDKPADGYDASTMAADIDALTTQLGLKRYFIVGHDMGAPVALCHAASYAPKVRGLVYLDEPLPGFNIERMARFADDNPSLLWWYPFHMVPDLDFSDERADEILVGEAWGLSSQPDTMFTRAPVDQSRRSRVR